MLDIHIKHVELMITKCLNEKRAVSMTHDEATVIIDANLKDCTLIGPEQGAILRAMVYCEVA